MPAVEGFAFGPFQLDTRARRLLRDGEPIPLGARQYDLLRVLLAKGGDVLSKDELIDAAWPDVAVTDNSLEQAISGLRRLLNDGTRLPYIETLPRRGYRFAQAVARLERRESDDALDALLAPHRAWIEGRAALETLERDQIARARAAFARVLGTVPEQAPVHVGLANACVMQFEATRADREPDRRALADAAHHAREACRLAPDYAEAWATLGFVLERTGDRADAVAAARRAVALEPDNWRHHFRLSYGTWGEERLRAARRTLALMPGFPMAHWLAATVHVARRAFAEAERELRLATARPEQHPAGASRFSAVALHWLLGLLAFARGDESAALEAFSRELEAHSPGHLYARECAANTWYAIGAVHLAHDRAGDARAAFGEALGCVAMHPLAGVGLAVLNGQGAASAGDGPADSVDAAICQAAAMVAAGRSERAAALVDRALAAAPPGNAGWLLPVEPLLRVWERAAVWAPVLARLQTRAA